MTTDNQQPEHSKRYVVVQGGQDEYGNIIWLIKDTVTGHGVMPDMKRYWYGSEDEAQVVCDRLNADSHTRNTAPKFTAYSFPASG